MVFDNNSTRDLYSRRLNRLAFFIERRQIPKPVMRRYALLVVRSTCDESRVKVILTVMWEYLKEWVGELLRQKERDEDLQEG